MSLKTNISGVLTQDEIKRLKFPVAWSGTVDAAEAASEEAELRELANEALESLDQAYLHAETDGELAVRFEAGEIAEIVEV